MMDDESDRAALTRLHDIIAQRSFGHGEERTLASGRKSNFYFDMKRTMSHPEGSALVARFFFERILAEPEKVVLIGGLAMGAVPLVTAVTFEAHSRGKDLPNFWVREKPKGHGTEATIEGQSPEALKNVRVVILDDVNTTGGSTLKAVKAARGAGARIDKAFAIVDRQEGASERLAEHGVSLVALFTASQFLQA